MTRSAALTVRLPGVRTMPAIRTSRWLQTGAVKNSRKGFISEVRTGSKASVATDSWGR